MKAKRQKRREGYPEEEKRHAVRKMNLKAVVTVPILAVRCVGYRESCSTPGKRAEGPQSLPYHKEHECPRCLVKNVECAARTETMHRSHIVPAKVCSTLSAILLDLVEECRDTALVLDAIIWWSLGRRKTKIKGLARRLSTRSWWLLSMTTSLMGQENFCRLL